MTDLSRINVCLLAGTLGQGGAERQLFYILQALRQSGATPRLLCLERGEFWEERIRQLDVPIAWVGQSRSKLMRLYRIICELRRHPTHVFQSQHFYTSAYVGAASGLLGLCGIGALRSDGRHEVLDAGIVGGWLSLRIPKVMAANSRVAIEYARNSGVQPRRLYLLSNVVNTARFTPAPRRCKVAVRLITVGRLVKAKRVDRFLSVLARLRQSTNAEVSGIVVGGGPLRETLENQAKTLKLTTSAVEFRGPVSDMSLVYQEADICVLTSDHEGTPNVLLEAMACGLPVVATKVGGVPDIVHDGQAGILVEPGDEESLYVGLERLIKNASLRREFGENARSYINANHSLGNLPARLSGLYQMALS